MNAESPTPTASVNALDRYQVVYDTHARVENEVARARVLAAATSKGGKGQVFGEYNPEVELAACRNKLSKEVSSCLRLFSSTRSQPSSKGMTSVELLYGPGRSPPQRISAFLEFVGGVMDGGVAPPEVMITACRSLRRVDPAAAAGLAQTAILALLHPSTERGHAQRHLPALLSLEMECAAEAGNGTVVTIVSHRGPIEEVLGVPVVTELLLCQQACTAFAKSVKDSAIRDAASLAVATQASTSQQPAQRSGIPPGPVTAQPSEKQSFWRQLLNLRDFSSNKVVILRVLCAMIMLFMARRPIGVIWRWGSSLGGSLRSGRPPPRRLVL